MCIDGHAARRLTLALCLATALSNCAQPPPASGPSPPISAPATVATETGRYLPLPHDSVFTYRGLLPGSSQPESLILEIEHRRPEAASLRTGDNVQRVAFSESGVRLVTGGYLLKSPLSKNATWRGPVGTVQVVAVDLTIQVGAGTFAGCLETRESGGSGLASRLIVTTYCPDVGIVRFSAENADGERTFELEAFGPRVDINAL